MRAATVRAFRDGEQKRATRRKKLLAIGTRYQLARASEEYLAIYALERLDERMRELGDADAARVDVAEALDITADVIRLCEVRYSTARPVRLADGTAILRGSDERPRSPEYVLDPELRAHFRALEDAHRGGARRRFLDACQRGDTRELVVEYYRAVPDVDKPALRRVLDLFLLAADVADHARELFDNAGALAEEIAA